MRSDVTTLLSTAANGPAVNSDPLGISLLGTAQFIPLLTHFFHSAPFVMGVVECKDNKLTHIIANPAAESFLGLPSGYAAGKTMPETQISAEEESFWLERYLTAKREGRAVQFSNQSFLGEKKVWMQCTVLFVGPKENGGDLYCYICEDITEKRDLLENLKAERERFELAVEGTNAGLWDWNLSNGEVYYSRQYREMLGYSEVEFPNDVSSWQKLIHPEDLAHALESVRNYMEDKNTEYHLEHRLLCRDGSYRWILARGACTRDLQGKPVRFTGWHVDIHELRSTVEELKRRDAIIDAQQVKIFASAKMSSLGEMAGSIAHEINNPLAIIALSANQISDAFHRQPINTAIVDESVQKIESTVARIGKIVKGLRAFSRSGENDPFAPCRIELLVNDTLELCRERFRSLQIELRVPKIPNRPVDCRGVQISQVFLNLLSNSLDAVRTQANAWVELKVEEEENGLLFSVTDSGAGISPKISARMMEPFFTTKEVGEGTGLGLSIAKGILEDHGSSLEFDATSSNTRFFFRLPYFQP